MRRDSASPPRHRVIRDAVEAEELAVEWLRWVGFADAHRLGDELPDGISGTGVRALATFDPLPLERAGLIALRQWADGQQARAVGFSFAGWTPETYDLATQLDVALLRYTFAGHIEPDNSAARRMLDEPGRSAPDADTERS